MPLTTEEFAVSYDNTNTKTIPTAALTQTKLIPCHEQHFRARAEEEEEEGKLQRLLRPPSVRPSNWLRNKKDDDDDDDEGRERCAVASERPGRSTVREPAPLVLGEEGRRNLVGAAA